MTKSIDLAALDPDTRRLVERGVREAYGISLAEFLDDTAIGGVDLTADDIEGLWLAGNSPNERGCPSYPAVRGPTTAAIPGRRNLCIRSQTVRITTPTYRKPLRTMPWILDGQKVCFLTGGRSALNVGLRTKSHTCSASSRRSA